ncbi:MAG: NAD(P)-dependent alcohol dehydrogenase [Polyangia bacterium]
MNPPLVSAGNARESCLLAMLSCEVLVAIAAASVNPVDWKVRVGELKLITGRTFPKTLGSDFAGVVERVGAGVAVPSVGNRVYGITPMMMRKPGAHAERLVVARKRLRRMPDGLSFEQAAALPVAGLTALNGLRQCGDLHGKTVLINGGTGGVGHFAVQIAKARGATVTAVCRERNAGRARSLGADVVIDYRKQDFTDSSVRYDVVFDAFGHLKYPAVARVLTDRGVLVTTLPAPSLIARAVWQRVVGDKHIVLGNLRDRPEDYAELERLLADGSVKPVIDKIVPLAEAAQAYAALEAGGTVGKVIIRIA